MGRHSESGLGTVRSTKCEGNDREAKGVMVDSAIWEVRTQMSGQIGRVHMRCSNAKS